MKSYNTFYHNRAQGWIGAMGTGCRTTEGNLTLGGQSRSPHPYGDYSPNTSYSEPERESPGSVSEDRLDTLVCLLEDFIRGPLNGWEKKELATYAESFPDELFRFAVERACAYGRYYWHYVRGILDNLGEKGIRTLADAQADRDAFDRKRARRSQGYSKNNIYPMTVGRSYECGEGESL